MTTKQLNTITRKAEAVAAKHTAEAKANEATPATRYPFAAFVILETEADRAAKVANKAEAEATRKAEADPTPENKAAAKEAAKVAKEARKAADEAAKTAPRYSFDIVALDMKEAHTIAEAAHATATTEPAARIRVNMHYLTKTAALDPERLIAAARQVAKKTAANMMQREGTKTQQRIDEAARRRDWNEHDLADLVSEAKEALTAAAALDPATVETYRNRAAALNEAAAALDTVSIYDRAAILAIINRAEAIAPEVVDEAATNRRRAAVYNMEAEAAAILQSNPTDPATRRAALEIATRAAYAQLNGYLTDQRAIRTDEKPAPLSLDELDEMTDPRQYDPEAITEAEATRRAFLKRAFSQVFAALSPRAAVVFRLMYKGMTAAQISKHLNIDESTTREHIRNITETTAAILATADPEAAETKAANIAAITAGIEATEAAAKLEAKRKAAKAERAKAKAAAAIEATAKEAAETKATEATEAARRAEAIAEAIAKTAEALTPTARKVYDTFKSGAGTRKTAEILHKGVATIDEHKKNITRKIAAAVMEAAPDIDPDIIAAADLATLLKLAK